MISTYHLTWVHRGSAAAWRAGYQQGLDGPLVAQKWWPVRWHLAMGKTFSSAIFIDTHLKRTWRYHILHVIVCTGYSVLMPKQSGLRLPSLTERTWSSNKALCRAKYHETRFLVDGQHRPTKSQMPHALSHCTVSQMCSPTPTCPCWGHAVCLGQGCRIRLAQISVNLLLKTPKPSDSSLSLKVSASQGRVLFSCWCGGLYF